MATTTTRETTTTATITLEREHVIEAVARLCAAWEVLLSLNDATDTELLEGFERAGWNLFSAAFGDDINDAEDDEWHTTPERVEVWARSQEYAAAFAEPCRARQNVLAHRLSIDNVDELTVRCTRYKASATRMREAGTIAVNFLTGEVQS